MSARNAFFWYLDLCFSAIMATPFVIYLFYLLVKQINCGDLNSLVAGYDTKTSHFPIVVEVALQHASESWSHLYIVHQLALRSNSS